jgi:hypothetical protein
MTTMSKFATTAVSALALAGIAAGLAGPLAVTASAASDPANSVDQHRQALQTAIDARQAQTGKLQAQVDGSKYLTADHKTALSAEIASTNDGLAAIEAQLPGAADDAALKSLRTQMIDSYRVYVVLTPKVHETMADDAETDGVADFAKVDAKLSAAITTAQSNGKDVAQAQADLADMRSHVTAASADIAGLDATIASFEPAGYPADKGSIEQTRTSLRNGRDDLKAARLDARKVTDDLK